MASKQKQEKSPYRIAEPQTPASPKSWLGNWRQWLNIILLFLVLEIAVLSIEQARWIKPQPLLTLILVLAILTVWLLVRSRLPGMVVHFLALAVGSLVTWWQVTIVTSPGEATLPFAVFIAFLTWVMGYIATWFLLRRQNAWVAVSLGAVVILVNLSNLPEKYYIFFGLYFVAAILLIVQTRLVKKDYSFELSSGYLRRGLLYFVTSLVCLGILAVFIAREMPELRAPGLQTMIATKILWKHDLEESRFNFFGAVPAKQAAKISGTRQDLLFEENWYQGDQVHFVVSSSRPTYWRVHVYDTYTSQGWTNHPVDKYMLERDVPWNGDRTPPARDTMTYTVVTNLKTDVLLNGGEFISSDTPTLVHVGSGEIVAVTTPRILSPSEHYTVTSGISSAIRDNLLTAGQDYPQHIKDNYLQLPPDFPEKVRQLSENITMMAFSPYAKVNVINWYLSDIPYEEEIEPPPPGTDGVEHFLFTQKSGFCLYFASAMAVMLRSVDVPSRLVVGYLPGEQDADTGKYVLQDKHYHAWPQAYFPGSGWVDLEVTPSTESSGVDIETPWITDHITREWQQQDAWQEWQAMFTLYGLMDFTPGDARSTTEFRERHWPFADIVGRTLLYIVLSAFALAILITPLLTLRSAFYRWLWRVNRSDCASTEYAKMSYLTSQLQLGPRPHQTPLEYAAELTSVFPQQSRSVDIIVQTYLRNRYGHREAKLSLFEEAEVLKSRCDLFRTLLKRMSFFSKLFPKR